MTRSSRSFATATWEFVLQAYRAHDQQQKTGAAV
jgi:hypothetical protein